MITKRYQSILLLSLSILLFKCKQEEEIVTDKPFIQVTNNQAINTSYNAGAVQEFRFKITSQNNLDSIYITRRASNSIDEELLLADDLPIETEVDYSWLHQFPTSISSDSADFVYEIMAKDQNRNEGKISRNFRIFRQEITLTEYTGFTIYTHLERNAKADGFNLEELTPEQSILASADEVDVVDDTTANTSDTLSRAFISYSDAKFVRSNSFNYPVATDISLKNAFDSGVIRDKISDIEVEDLILVRFTDENNMIQYAVIKITGVFNESGTANDRYTFNVKKAAI